MVFNQTATLTSEYWAISSLVLFMSHVIVYKRKYEWIELADHRSDCHVIDLTLRQKILNTTDGMVVAWALKDFTPLLSFDLCIGLIKTKKWKNIQLKSINLVLVLLCYFQHLQLNKKFNVNYIEPRSDMLQKSPWAKFAYEFKSRISQF